MGSVYTTLRTLIVTEHKIEPSISRQINDDAERDTGGMTKILMVNIRKHTVHDCIHCYFGKEVLEILKKIFLLTPYMLKEYRTA